MGNISRVTLYVPSIRRYTGVETCRNRDSNIEKVSRIILVTVVRFASYRATQVPHHELAEVPRLHPALPGRPAL